MNRLLFREKDSFPVDENKFFGKKQLPPFKGIFRRENESFCYGIDIYSLSHLSTGFSTIDSSENSLKGRAFFPPHYQWMGLLRPRPPASPSHPPLETRVLPCQQFPVCCNAISAVESPLNKDLKPPKMLFPTDLLNFVQYPESSGPNPRCK